MIPITLTIKGVYSYKNKQTIDFRELTSDHLFGIFGTVGSGKSSILEAITFALYGRIERLSKQGLKYNMMNLSSNELFIDFTFQANDGQYYNTVSQYKRNSKRHGDINSASRTCYKLDPANFELKSPMTTEEIEGKIGLSYENFKRTIIIPQGKFQEFLKLGTKDRSNMLEEIFDLKQFNLYGKAQTLIGKSLTRKSEIEGSLSTLGPLNPEEPELLKTQIETLLNSIAEKSSEKAKVEAQKNILDQQQKELEEIAATTEKLQKAEANRPAIERRRLDLAQFRTFLSVFKPILEQQKGISDQLKIVNYTLTNKQEELKTTLEKLESTQKQLNELTPEYEKRAILLEKAADIEHLIEVAKANEKVLKLEQITRQLNQEILTKKGLQGEQQTKVKQSEQQLESLKSSLIDITLLNDVKSWHLLKEKIVKEGLEKSLRAKLLQEEHLKLDAEISALLKEANVEMSEDLRQVHTEIAQQTALLKQQQHDLEAEIGDLKLAQQLSQYADTLHDGKPCPLCGAMDHPNIRAHKDVTQILAEKQERHRSILASIERMTKLETQLQGKEEQKASLTPKITTAQSELETQRAEFKHHESTFIFDEQYKEKALVETEIERYKSASKRIAELEKEIKTIRIAMETALLELSQMEEQAQQAALQKTEFRTIINQRTEGLKHLTPAAFVQKAETELEQIKNECIRQHKALEAQFELLTQTVSDHKNRQSTLDGRLQELLTQSKNIAIQQSEIEQRMKTEAQNHPLMTTELVARFSSNPLDIDTEEQAIHAFDTLVITWTSALKTLKEKQLNTTYDASLHQQLMEQIVALGQQIQTDTERKGQVAKQLEILTKQLAEHETLLTELNKLGSRISDLNKIAGMFKGNGFVNYVSTYYLENLCKEANKRFVRLTNGHLELVLSSDNSFDVIDHLNNGYTRSSDSLSGGQTFQASLCLALALSDAINRKSNIQQNFFFMDEGFGSLDSQSLHTVFQTLQALRMENRIVGLISHVEEMKQEIPKCLIITNTDEAGSKIGYSWK